jgi:hypothetical protein
VGRCIALRRRRRFCLMFSVFDLTYLPLGTTLSVFALLLLLKPQVQQEFAQSGTPRAATPLNTKH